MKRFFLPIFAILLSMIFGVGAALAGTGTISSPHNFAWSPQIGWVDFSQAGVTDTGLVGQAWGGNYGWIDLNGVGNNVSGSLSGYAWGKNVGWINFAGVTINSSGQFTGTATGNIVSTIDFPSSCSPNCVQTTWRPSSPQTGGGGGGGGPAIVYIPSIIIQTPDGGGSYNAGSTIGLDWTSANGAFTKYKVSYSIDSGASWTTISDNAAAASLSWTVPNSPTTLGKIKIEGYA